MQCKICNAELHFLGKHLENKHQLTQKEYYDKYLKKDNEGYCLHCGKALNFIKLSKGYGLFCSTKCQANSQYRHNKIKETCIKKYGVENPYQTEYAKECSYKAIEKRKKNQKEKMYQKYGVENPWQLPEIINKIQQARYDRTKQFEEIHNVISMQSLINLYGNGWKESKLLNIPRIYDGKFAFIDKRYLPIIINYYKNHNRGCASEPEFELIQLINSIYLGTIIKRCRKIIPPLELDIYIPELKLAVEFNGNYYHQNRDNNYHLNKSIMCREKGIRLIHIYEFENFEQQKQLLKDLILGKDNYPKDDFNKNNFGFIPERPEIICTSPYIIYGAGKLL